MQNQRLIRIILIVAVILVTVCMVGILIYRIFTGGDQIAGPPPTPTPTESPEVVITPEPTATPTRVITEEPTSTPTVRPTATNTPTATVEPTATPAPTVVVTGPGPVEDLLKNGGFEDGFNEQGVGLNWNSFKNDGADVSFSNESAAPFIQAGAGAQRISIENAFQPNRYAGIYQTVAVAPGQNYTLTLYGQIRTYFAEAKASGYGYVVQYAIDQQGGEDWQSIPETDWIELPWGEQPFHTAQLQFSEYTTSLTAASGQMTIFVRAWNKWPDPKLSEYTFDSLSLVGPAPGRIVSAEEKLVDHGLPTTGAGDSSGFISDGRFWVAVVVLLLLAGGAIYRGRWSY